MINSISINKVASFEGPGVQTTDLKKINFIYGANGSGKTTISNLIANPDNEDYQECTVNWQHGIPLKTLVYNKQFRENNFGRGKIEGVFTLGQATKADIELIKLKQEELSELKTYGIKRKEAKEKQEEKKKNEESAFKEQVWKNLYKKNEIRKIKNEEGNIKQMVLLTHNVYFHKEVSFIDGRSNGDKDTFYWILRKMDKTSSIQPFGMKNPIQTSYELLWQELKNIENNSGVTIQNTMRRIIDNYFKILGKYGDDDLISQFTSKEEQEIYRSLLCWINDGSHSISDDLYIESPADTIDKYLKVFQSIFKLTRHEEHYNMMMGFEA